MGQRIEDMIGRRFSLLVVEAEVEPKVIQVRGKTHKRRHYRCACDCGERVVADQGNLRSGNTTSCGCWKLAVLNERSTKHGHASRAKKHDVYQIWSTMLQRCRNPSSPKFEHYGGRGIAVCERWLQFENFLADMGERPTPKHWIDRIKNDGNYEPGNCRWSTAAEQALNKRTYKNARMVTYRGQRMCVSRAARASGINEGTLRSRLDKGWSDERALS